MYKEIKVIKSSNYGYATWAESEKGVDGRLIEEYLN